MLRALAVVALLASTAHADERRPVSPGNGRIAAPRPLCGPGAKYHGATVDLDVKDADIHDLYRLLADVGNINIVVADNVQGKVTMKLKRVAWDLVACTIASMKKLEVTVQDNVVLVKKP